MLTRVEPVDLEWSDPTDRAVERHAKAGNGGADRHSTVTGRHFEDDVVLSPLTRHDHDRLIGRGRETVGLCADEMRAPRKLGDLAWRSAAYEFAVEVEGEAGHRSPVARAHVQQQASRLRRLQV